MSKRGGDVSVAWRLHERRGQHASRGGVRDTGVRRVRVELAIAGPWRSLGWVVARDEVDNSLLAFVNVPWDGLVHAWIQDTMVAGRARRRGIGKRVVEIALEEARRAGCEWMHVDFEDHLRSFYFDACGFKPTNAGLIAL